MSWNKQYNAGRWNRGTITQGTLNKVMELCNGGRLVEFGCSDGTLPLSVPKHLFSDYTGYDLSDSAVRRAQERVREAGLTGITFCQGDMAKWKGISSAALIVAEECLYYLSTHDTETFLQRCCDSLVPDGKILIIVHSATKHQQTLETCRRVCHVCDESVDGERVYLTLSPKERAAVKTK